MVRVSVRRFFVPTQDDDRRIPVTLRQVFLELPDTSHLVSLPRNLKVTVRRGKFSVAGRKETPRPWWVGGHDIAEEYTHIETMSADRFIPILQELVGVEECNKTIIQLIS